MSKEVINTSWTELPKPIMALAPLADVTDAAFRRVIAKCGKPDAMWTEFVSADGLYHTRELKKMPDEENPLMRDLIFSDSERPIIAQFFTAKPDMMEYAAQLAVELGFDGVDINMGCPDRSIEKQGAGAMLIKNPALAKELIEAARRGSAAAGRSNLPLSVKTRVGYAHHDEFRAWMQALLACDLDAMTLHARTRKEMSKVPARWEHIKKAVAMRDAAGSKTLILGNGDVASLQVADEKVRETGADGIMIGRGIFGNPWRFSREQDPEKVPLAEKLRVLAEHARLFQEFLPHKNFAIMKKHFKAYVSGFDGAAELRAALMNAGDSAEVTAIVHSYLRRRS